MSFARRTAAPVNPEAYVEMAATESRHWWFRARRKIIESTIAGMALPAAARILEVGCGTGGNLVMLARHGQVSAMEMDDHARQMAVEKTQGSFVIHAGSCPDDIPFQGERFDLICLFDVLEHIEQEVATLNRLRQQLVPGGRMLITVPAYQWLWSAHDTHLHHKRRYTAKRLRRVFRDGRLKVDRITYFNMLLLPLAALGRLLDRAMSRQQPSGTTTPAAPINATLHAIFASERHVLRHIDLPAGVSLMGIAHAA